MALTNLEVVSVPVSDQDLAKSFYTEKLGFSVETDSSFGGGGMRWVALRPPGSGTAITLVTWFETMPAGSLKGSVPFEDPDGNSWVLQQNNPSFGG